MNKLLLPQDIVGGSFWLISVAMIGAAIFFFLERRRLSDRWSTVMTLVGVIALMSSIHYFYAKNLWVLNGQAPTQLRYIDWLLTFPLTILTFYVMLKSVSEVKRGMFWRLLVGTLVWVIAQLLGAYGYMSVTLGFLVGIVGWLYIIGELYMGDAAGIKLNTTVMPFIIRGVKLWGINSVTASIPRRQFLWNEASRLIDFELLEKSVKEIGLDDLNDIYVKMLKGETSGRYIINLSK